MQSLVMGADCNQIRVFYLMNVEADKRKLTCVIINDSETCAATRIHCRQIKCGTCQALQNNVLVQRPPWQQFSVTTSLVEIRSIVKVNAYIPLRGGEFFFFFFFC